MFLLTLGSCLRRNVLSRLDNPMNATESALYSLEEGSGADAIAKLEKMLKEEDRKILDDPNSTIVQKKDALIHSWGNRPDRDTLYSLFAIASVSKEGISLLRVIALLANEKRSKEDVIGSIISSIPFNQKTIQSLDLFIILSDIITTPKNASVLIKEALIITINLAARIAVLDTTESGIITKTNIEKMTAEQGEDIYRVLDKAATTMKKAYDLNPNELNAKIESKIAEIKSKLDGAEGSNKSEKTKAYLIELLKKNGPIKLNNFLQTYISKKDAPRIAPKKAFLIPARKELEDKYKFYLSLQTPQPNGWIADVKCDGLLFNSLYAISGGNADVTLALNKSTGQWFRNPEKDCYPNHSHSSISRDMLIGLSIWIWQYKKLDLLNQLIAYGTAHANKTGDWIMGEEEAGGNSVALNAPFRKLLYAMKDALEGKTPSKLSDEILTPVEGYETHLQVLHFYLQGLIFKGINEVQLSLLSLYLEREPKNALFSYLYHLYVDGDMTDAVSDLLDTKYFPNPRLPSTEDRCEFYLWQRNMMKNGSTNPDWLPCAEKQKTHSGLDFLFVASRILE